MPIDTRCMCMGASYTVRMWPMAMFWLVVLGLRIRASVGHHPCFSWWFVVAFPIVYIFSIFTLVFCLHLLFEVKSATKEN